MKTQIANLLTDFFYVLSRDPKIDRLIASYDIPILKQRYRIPLAIAKVSVFVMFIITFVVLLLLYSYVFNLMLETKMNSVDYIFFVTPDWYVFGIICLFIGLICSGYISEYIIAKLGKLIEKSPGEWRAVWLEYWSKQFGGRAVDPSRALRALIIVSLPILLAAIYLSFDYYHYFSSDKIHVNTFLSIGERTYSYQEVTEIQYVSNDKGSRFVIVFTDGFKLPTTNFKTVYTREAPSYNTRQYVGRIIELVSAKSGKEVNTNQ